MENPNELFGQPNISSFLCIVNQHFVEEFYIWIDKRVFFYSSVFLWCLYLIFILGWCWPYNLEAFPPLLYFGKVCEVFIILFKIFSRIHHRNHPVLHLFFWEVPKLWIQSLYLFVSLLRLSIFSWLSFSRLCLPRNLSISCRLSILLIYSCSLYTLRILFISVKLIVMSPLSFLNLVIWVLFS